MGDLTSSLIMLGGELPLPLLAGLIILAPRILEVVHVPMPLTALVMGLLWSGYYTDPLVQPTVDMVATVAITMLFLFAGLEVELSHIRRERKSYAVLAGVHLLVLVCVGLTCRWLFGLELKGALILAIGLVTPSAGYILDAVGKMRLHGSERQDTGHCAIGLEVTSLGALLVILRMDAPWQLPFLVGGIACAFVLLPRAWRLLELRFFSLVPRAEFVTMFMLAMLFAHLSKAIGLYYIFGAFMTGMILGKINQERFKPETKNYLSAVELMTALFLPVYFFRAGASIPIESLSILSIALGLGLTMVLAARMLPVLAARRFIGGESLASCYRVSMALAPTLVFGLVIADLLHTRTKVPDWIVGALIIHTLLVSIVPVILLRGVVTEMDPFHEKSPANSSTVKQGANK